MFIIKRFCDVGGYCCPAESGDFLPDPPTCGKTPAVPRIMNGKEVQLNSLPWMALLIYQNRKTLWRYSTTMCAGSLINSRYVLTAAHCLYPAGDYIKSVRLGEHDTSTNPDTVVLSNGGRKTAPPYLEVNVEDVVRHHNFYEHEKIYINDIALLRLELPVRYTREIRPICLLPDYHFANNYFENSSLRIAGWGASHIQSNKVLLSGNVKGLNPSECQKLHFRRDIHICAGGQDGTDTCKGDSGGPLMATMGTSYNEFVYLAGITSYGSSECGWRPGVYTSTIKFIDWIKTKIKP
uniref:Serine protease easter-like n=1 Tax=Drosophila rhopaloa TaxID=1041015 RepID=A0A6P4F3U8_DRORH